MTLARIAKRRATEALVARAQERGVLPLEVMFDNLEFWARRARAMERQLKRLVVNVDDPASIRDLNFTLNKLAAARERSQECAVDAAPYCHHRLATITVTGDPEAPVQHKITGELALKDAADAYARTINGPEEPVAAKLH